MIMGALTLASRRGRYGRIDTGYRSYDLDRQDPDRINQFRNLHWLCTEMERLSDDVIDREICKRLRQFAGRIEYDLPDEVVRQLRGRSQTVSEELIPEALMPFYRHYNFMLRRENRALQPA